MTEPPRRSRGPWLLAAAAVIGAVAVFLVVNRGPDLEAIRVACLWARMNPLPASARNIETEVTGNPFTRSFRIHFTAEPADVEKWLRDSPGTRAYDPPRRTSFFKIEPGEGANVAEVTVDWNSGQVMIRAEWS